MWVLDLWPNYFFDTLRMERNAVLGNILDVLCRFIYRNCDNILLQSEAFFDPVYRLVPDHKGLIFFPNWAEEILEEIIIRSLSKKLKAIFICWKCWKTSKYRSLLRQLIS